MLTWRAVTAKPVVSVKAWWNEACVRWPDRPIFYVLCSQYSIWLIWIMTVLWRNVAIGREISRIQWPNLADNEIWRAIRYPDYRMRLTDGIDDIVCGIVCEAWLKLAGEAGSGDDSDLLWYGNRIVCILIGINWFDVYWLLLTAWNHAVAVSWLMTQSVFCYSKWLLTLWPSLIHLFWYNMCHSAFYIVSKPGNAILWRKLLWEKRRDVIAIIGNVSGAFCWLVASQPFMQYWSDYWLTWRLSSSKQSCNDWQWPRLQRPCTKLITAFENRQKAAARRYSETRIVVKLPSIGPASRNLGNGSKILYWLAGEAFNRRNWWRSNVAAKHQQPKREEKLLKYRRQLRLAGQPYPQSRKRQYGTVSTGGYWLAAEAWWRQYRNQLSWRLRDWMRRQ